MILCIMKSITSNVPILFINNSDIVCSLYMHIFAGTPVFVHAYCESRLQFCLLYVLAPLHGLLREFVVECTVYQS